LEEVKLIEKEILGALRVDQDKCMSFEELIEKFPNRQISVLAHASNNLVREGLARQFRTGNRIQNYYQLVE